MSWLISSLFALTPTCLFWENEITPLKTLGKVPFFSFFFLILWERSAGGEGQ